MEKVFLTISISCLIALGGCSNSSEHDESNTMEGSKKEAVSGVDVGVGPIKSVDLTDIDNSLAEKGKGIFEAKCTACHKMGKRYIGPDLATVLDRRSPEWIMNMILNPEGMVKENEAAKQLLMEYSAPMANQNLTEDETRSILEYFRTL